MFINLKISRRILSFGGIFFLLIVGIVAGRWVVASNTPVPKPIDQITTDQKLMALTINVDWGEEFIPAILDELEKNKAQVTFL